MTTVRNAPKTVLRQTPLDVRLNSFIIAERRDNTQTPMVSPMSPTTSTTKILGLVLALLLVLATSAVVAGQNGPPSSVPPGDDDDRPGGNETAGDDENDEDDNRPERAGRPHDDPRDQRRGHAAIGNGTVDGVYVTYTFSDDAGQIHDFAVFNATFFATIQAPAAFEEARASGPHVRIEGDGFEVRTMDNPTGLIRLEADDDGGGFTLTPADGVVVDAEADWIRLTADGLSAILTGGELEDGTIVVDEEGKFLLHGPSVSVVSRGANPSGDRILNAIAQGHIAGQIQVLPQGIEHVAFDDVSMASKKLDDNAYRFRVDANLSVGKTFVLDFAPGLLTAGELAVKYYDEELGLLVETGIAEASSLDDVLEADADEGPEYWIVKGLDGAQVLVAVPSFSVHAFDVIPAELVPIIAYGLALGILFSVVATAALVMGRRPS